MAPVQGNNEGKEAKVQYSSHNTAGRTHIPPGTKVCRAWRSLTGYNFSINRPDNFKVTLDNIAIYAGAAYDHDMGMTLKTRK